MGRRSPELKRLKRGKQKAKRKLKFVQLPETPSDQSTEQHSITEDNNETGPITSATSDAIGEDADVVRINLEDSVKRFDESEPGHSPEYLLECRQTLIRKVNKYRKQYEDAVTENARLAYEHRKDIETIRSFYQNIMYAPTRSGRIVKAASTTSAYAMEAMKELGIKYKYNGNEHIV